MSKIGSLIERFLSSLSQVALMIVARGIVVLVDAMAEAHQAEAAVFLLGQIDVFLDVAAFGPDLLEHLDARLVGPAVQRAPQAQMPAEIEANRLASLEPTMRTVDVLQFCSWSACTINSKFSASTKSGSISYGSHGTANIMCRKVFADTTDRCADR